MKITGYTILSIIVLLILLALSIQIPSVQQYITQKAVNYLQEKIGTKVSLEHFSLSFPKAVVLEGLFLEDQHKDTLLYAGRLAIDTDLWALTKNTIELNDVSLSQSMAFIKRSAKDSTFNFDYIARAFAGAPAQTRDTSAAPWKFNIGNVDLQDIYAVYIDSLSGNDARIQLSSLQVDVNSLDLEGASLDINTIELSDARGELVQWKGSEPPAVPPADTTTNGGFTVTFSGLSLKEIAADYKQLFQGQHIRLNLGEMEVTGDKVDVQSNLLKFNRISLSNTFLSYQQLETGNRKTKVTNPPPSRTSQNAQDPQDDVMTIAVKELDLRDNNIQYYDFNEPQVSGSVDFNHLWLTRLSTNAKDISIQNNNIHASVNELALVEKSGFSISSMKGTIDLSDTTVSLSNFSFQSPKTNIGMNMKGSFPSLNTLGETYPDAKISLDIKSSTVALSDILYFSPHLLDSIPLNIPPTTTLGVSAAAQGKIKDLLIDHLSIHALTNTSLALSGSIAGLPDQPQMDVTLHKFYSTNKDMNLILPDSMLPKNIVLPAWVNLEGSLNGSLSAPHVIALLKSDAGTVQLNAKIKQRQRLPPEYSGKVSTMDLDVGRILGQPEEMGKLNMEASVAGSGFTTEEINSRIDLTVHSFEYQQYTYKNFKLNGRLQRYFFSGKAALQDKNLAFVLEGDLDYNKDVPEYEFTFSLTNADFKALHLSERPLKARGAIDVKLATSDFTKINGNLDIRNVAIYNGKSLYAVDSLLFASIDQEGESKITIRSDILSGDFEGTINLTSIPQAFRRHFNEYFSLRDTTYSRPVAPQQFSFNLTLKNTELLTELIFPELEPFVPGTIEGQFDSEKHTLELHADVSRIRYGSIGLDSMSLNISSNKRSLDYSLNLRKILIDTLRIEALRLTGKVANDSIRTKMTVLDSLLKQKYVFGGAFYSEEKAVQFRLLPEEVMMYYAPWETPADNYLRFTAEGIIAHNFSISNINEKISLVTSDAQDARTAIVFKDLNLQHITNLVEGTILADGLINGDFVISGKGQFKSALNVKELKVFDQVWGDLGLKVAHENSGTYNIDLGIQGDNAELTAKGTFISDSAASTIDIVTDISRINLKIIDPITGNQLKNSSGIITGEVSVKGNVTSPQIRGFVAFENATIIPAFVNSKFLLKDERIAFTAEGIVLENFRVLDENNNVATLKGSIKTTTYTTFGLDLSLTAKNFQVLNSTEDDSELFYGKVGINTTAKIVGTLTQPKVTMQVSLNDDSNFTYIVPQSEKGVLEQQGIVIFVDKDAANDPFLAGINPRDTVKSKFTGLELTANIELDDKETFSIVIDPVTGDKLTVKGNSTLTLDIDPTGDMQLSGRYEITEGTYDLTFYKLVKRNFSIVKGSTITWAGDPLDATMDIRASFMVETSPMELVANQSSSLTTEELNMYRQRLPFLVYLNIDGRMLTPEISFELDMPLDKRNAFIYSKIKDINTRESDLNKQVFALLILRRFISDNLFDSESGGAVSTTARRSVSKLLTEQLNRLSENIKGIELSFDVKSYEDYSTGQAQGQTEVQLGVSKSLLDDRLVVKVSGNVDIEGNSSNQGSVSDYIGDLALEYKLTEDGRFRITGFRKSNYDIISGELIETGAGLIYIKDYNTLRELFKANAKEK